MYALSPGKSIHTGRSPISHTFHSCSGGNSKMLLLKPTDYMLVIKRSGAITFSPRAANRKAPPGAIRALTVHEWKAIKFSGEQKTVIRCYQNGNPLGDRCVQALLDIYQGLNYPVKHYTIQPGGIYWRDHSGTAVAVPNRYYGKLLNSEEMSTKPLMEINGMAYNGHKSTLSESAKKRQNLTPEQRALIARETGPLHAKTRQSAKARPSFDET